MFVTKLFFIIVLFNSFLRTAEIQNTTSEELEVCNLCFDNELPSKDDSWVHLTCSEFNKQKNIIHRYHRSCLQEVLHYQIKKSPEKRFFLKCSKCSAKIKPEVLVDLGFTPPREPRNLSTIYEYLFQYFSGYSRYLCGLGE